MTLNRRQFLSGSAAAAIFGAAGGCASARCCSAGAKYPGWKPGEMDIHFIHTGEAECTFFIFPDGTTMLLDCGRAWERKPGYAEAIPSAPSKERRAGEWVARYIERLIPQREIDYLMISHWHSDHINGIPDVAAAFKFANYFDHQFPNPKSYKSNVSEDGYKMIQEWLPSARKAGMKAEPFKVGGKDQIRLLHDARNYYSRVFEVRNIAANGVVWLGDKKGVRDVVGEHVRRTGADRVNENSLSAAIRIKYGNFSYFTGGDIEGDFTGADGKKFSYEALVGSSVGHVEVCKTNHHACPASMRDDFIRSTSPQLFLSSTWSPNQINSVSLPRMASRELYPGPRTIAFCFVPEFKKKAYEGRDFMRDVVDGGHQVVKVAPGGFWYRLYTLTAMDESMRIVAEKDFYCC